MKPERPEIQPANLFETPFPKIFGVACSAKVGEGSFLQLRFPDDSHILWIYCCGWHAVDSDKGIIAASEDDRANIERFAERLDGDSLIGAKIEASGSVSTFAFKSGLLLSTFALYSREEPEQWMFFYPDGVLTLLSNGKLLREDLV